MWWGSFGKGDPERAAQSDAEFILRVLRIARFDKVVVGAVSVVASLIPFWSSLFGTPSFGVAGSVALSLATSFAFVLLYSVQTLSSFLSAESWGLLSSLPLSRSDLSLVTLLSFVRTADYMVVGAVAGQVFVVAYVTHSPVAALVVLLAAGLNMLLAVTVSLRFSRVFYGSLSRGGRSKRGTLLRAAFLGLWGVVLVSIGFLFSSASYLLPFLNSILLGGSSPYGLALSLVYPFPLAIVVAGASGAVMSGSITQVAVVGFAIYLLLGALLLRWGLGMLREMSLTSGLAQSFGGTRDFTVKVRRPFVGYMMKDLRASSRNPATAFLYAMPVFETVVVLLVASNLPVIRAPIVLVATALGGAATLFLPLGLLNAEGGGLTYTRGLPVRVETIVASKAAISTLTYLAVPVAMLGLAAVKPLTSGILLLLPVELLASTAAASIVEVWLFLGLASETRTSAMLHDLTRLLAGGFVMVLPEVAYVVTYLLLLDHPLAVLAGGVVAVAELWMAIRLLKLSRPAKGESERGGSMRRDS
jgi:predicted permease